MFIVLECIDGSGKSTQAARLVSWLRSLRGGSGVLWTREPGDWTGGKALRQILLEGDLRHPHSELFLFLADRCEHVTSCITPALLRNEWVVCERYCDSTLAYQCWGRGLPRRIVEELFSWCHFPRPDLALWIDIPRERAMERLEARGELDRIEQGAGDFLDRVHQGFAVLSHEEPAWRRRIDGNQDVTAVESALRSEVLQALGNLP